jgi:hypothetical protein
VVKWVQSNNLLSVPVHWTLSINIGPVPCPKKAKEKARAPVLANSFWIMINDEAGGR